MILSCRKKMGSALSSHGYAKHGPSRNPPPPPSHCVVCAGRPAGRGQWLAALHAGPHPPHQPPGPLRPGRPLRQARSLLCFFWRHPCILSYACCTALRCGATASVVWVAHLKISQSPAKKEMRCCMYACIDVFWKVCSSFFKTAALALETNASCNRYTSPFSMAKRFGATLGELTGGRVGLTCASIGILKVPFCVVLHVNIQVLEGVLLPTPCNSVVYIQLAPRSNCCTGLHGCKSLRHQRVTLPPSKS